METRTRTHTLYTFEKRYHNLQIFVFWHQIRLAYCSYSTNDIKHVLTICMNKKYFDDYHWPDIQTFTENKIYLINNKYQYNSIKFIDVSRRNTVLHNGQSQNLILIIMLMTMIMMIMANSYRAKILLFDLLPERFPFSLTTTRLEALLFGDCNSSSTFLVDGGNIPP